jgi:hypothetical protein
MVKSVDLENLTSDIKNKHKREDIYHKQKAAKAKAKRDRRLQLKKDEEKNPELKEVPTAILLYINKITFTDCISHRLVSRKMFQRQLIIQEKRRIRLLKMMKK